VESSGGLGVDGAGEFMKRVDVVWVEGVLEVSAGQEVRASAYRHVCSVVRVELRPLRLLLR